MSDFVEYKPMEVEHNVKAAVENLRKAYWSNETEKVAKHYTEAEDIIISAICHGGYTVCKETTQGDLISREALKKSICIDEPISIDETWEQLYDAVVKAIDNAPTVEPERPQGEWIRKEDVIKLLEKWSDGYSYIEIPTDDAIKEIKNMKGGEE